MSQTFLAPAHAHPTSRQTLELEYLAFLDETNFRDFDGTAEDLLHYLETYLSDAFEEEIKWLADFCDAWDAIAGGDVA